MYLRRRHRYVVPGTRLPSASSMFVGVLLLAAFVMLFRWGWNVLSLPLKGETPATLLTVIGRGEVQVSLAGSSDLRTAQTGLRLYPDDRVITPRNAFAELTFFEGTTVRLGEGSELLIEEVFRSERSSLLTLALEEGSLFVETGSDPDTRRLIETTQAAYALTPSLVALFEETESTFLDTSGPGVEVRIPPKGRQIATLLVSEGQMLSLNKEMLLLLERGGDPYQIRKALPPDVTDQPFVRFNLSRSKPASPPPPGTETARETDITPLTLLAPEDGERVNGNTVMVRGRISERVRNIRINGYSEPVRGPLFEKEISLANEEEVTIAVTVEDAEGIEIGEIRRTVHRDLQPPPAPTILRPGSGGSIVTLTEPETVIEGTTASETVAVIVNGYRLQQFTEGDTTWRYIASAELQNLSFGENTYTVVAHDRSGNVSAPATIILLWSPEGIPPGEGGAEQSSSTGTGLTVFAPSPASPFETTESEILLEGNAPPLASTISINGYQLRLFRPGSPTWNYILREDFGNFRPGLNRYVIEAKDEEGEVLARMTYQVRRIGE